MRIDAGGISKVHAYFMTASGEPTLGDAGSTFGSFVRGEQLPKGARVKLESSDPLQLGPINAVFYTSESLYDFLHTIYNDPEGAKL